jgi:hypothetical protein
MRLENSFLGAAIAFTVGTFGMVSAQENPLMNYKGPIINQNVTSHNQSGGITAHTVTVNPRRTLASPQMEGLKRQMLSELSKDKPITVMGIWGDTESCMFAEEIHAFLKANGFNMKEANGISQGVFTRTPRGLIVEPEGDGLKFVVGVAN